MQQHGFHKQSKSAPIGSIDLDFIPYACHYDEETVLTKQGELLKVIKLEDYISPNNYSDLRTEIRKSIAKNIDTQYCTVWIHTIRKRNKISLQWNETKDFSDHLHSALFTRLTDSKLQYINELYIVILINNFDERISSALFFNHIKNKHKLSLEKKHKDLEGIADLIHMDLQPFGAKKLGLRFHQGEIYSEVMEFIYYMITLTYKEYPLSQTDLSQSMKDFQVAFGFNTFQTIFHDNRKFGSILSIKEYKEIPLGNINKCLQLNSEMIITEIIIFISNSKAIKDFKKQINTLQASEDNELMQHYGVMEIINYDKAPGINFCQQKFICTVFADNKEELAKSINDLSCTMSAIGLMMFRTDLHMENHFWAQLPGNFVFITHPRTILTKYAGSFTILHDFTSGMLKGGRWGEAITIFCSKVGDPYFFNFHGKKNSGHTTVLGTSGSGRTSLINFLLSESRKFNPRIVMLDNTGKSMIFTKAVGGKYYIVDPQYKGTSLKFNPLNIEDSDSSRKMLCELIRRMVARDDITEKIKKVVDSIFMIPKQSRSILQISEILSLLGGNIDKWYGDGEFAYLFSDTDGLYVDWETKIITINTANLTKQKECMSVVLYYFLYSFELKCDGSPTILVLDEAWEISDVFSTEEEFDDWMKRMTRLNVVVVFSTENLNLAFISKFTQYLDKHIDTRILMPDINADRLYMKALSLSKEELSIILQTPTQDGLFLIKQYKGLVTLSLDLKDMQEIYVLSAKKETIQYMYEATKEKGEQVNEWLPVFYEKCKV